MHKCWLMLGLMCRYFLFVRLHLRAGHNLSHGESEATLRFTFRDQLARSSPGGRGMNRAPHGVVGEWIRARACDMHAGHAQRKYSPACEVRNGHTECVQRYAVTSTTNPVPRDLKDWSKP